ncbi:MAG: hypothetical protein R3C18_09050 [Planctomycetaceae bacterium]
MSDAAMAAIKGRAGSDAINAYKQARPERAVHGHNVSNVEVTSSFVGYVSVVSLNVTTNAILFKNTTYHRIELIYGLDGEYRQMKSIEDLSECNLSLPWS